MSLILVVDDATLERETVAKLLEHEGFQTVKASSGKEAFATLYAQTPDLILLDLMMPEMDGIHFLKMLRHHPRWGNLPVIVLTGVCDDNKLAIRARELHVDEMVPKATFGFEYLLMRIRKAIADRNPSAN